MEFKQGCWSLADAEAGLRFLDDDALIEDQKKYDEWLASCWPESLEFLCGGCSEQAASQRRVDRFQTLRWAVLDRSESANKLTGEQALKLGTLIVQDMADDKEGLHFAKSLEVIVRKCPELVEQLAGFDLTDEGHHFYMLGLRFEKCQSAKQLRRSRNLLPRYGEKYVRLRDENGRRMFRAKWPARNWAMPSAAEGFIDKVTNSPDLKNHERVLSLICAAVDLNQHILCHPALEENGLMEYLVANKMILHAAMELQQRVGQLEFPS